MHRGIRDLKDYTNLLDRAVVERVHSSSDKASLAKSRASSSTQPQMQTTGMKEDSRSSGNPAQLRCDIRLALLLLPTASPLEEERPRTESHVCVSDQACKGDFLPLPTELWPNAPAFT